MDRSAVQHGKWATRMFITVIHYGKDDGEASETERQLVRCEGLTIPSVLKIQSGSYGNVTRQTDGWLGLFQLENLPYHLRVIFQSFCNMQKLSQVFPYKTTMFTVVVFEKILLLLPQKR
jgi:hypothetical protein